MLKKLIEKVATSFFRLNKPTLTHLNPRQEIAAAETAIAQKASDDLRPKVYRIGPQSRRYDSFLTNEIWVKSSVDNKAKSNRCMPDSNTNSAQDKSFSSSDKPTLRPIPRHHFLPYFETLQVPKKVLHQSSVEEKYDYHRPS